MASKRPRFTENFSANLSAIEEFVAPHSRTAFHRFLYRFFDEVIPIALPIPAIWPIALNLQGEVCESEGANQSSE